MKFTEYLFCKNYISLISLPIQTKTMRQLFEVIEEKKVLSESWWTDKELHNLFSACPVTQYVYKLVRDNQSVFLQDPDEFFKEEQRDIFKAFAKEQSTHFVNHHTNDLNTLGEDLFPLWKAALSLSVK